MTGLTPWLSPYADALLALASPQRVQVTSTYRSYSEQLQLWRNRSSNPYPVAPPGRSWHQYGRAFDLSANPELLRQLGAVWRSWGGTWNESDVIHFQA
jgi:uncharacterized protein YcbK (DUF882 family)